MNALTPPKRRFEITMTVGGDTMKDAVRLIESFADGIMAGSTNQVSGGYSSGGHFKLTENPDMTHEKYAAALHDYLESAKGRE